MTNKDLLLNTLEYINDLVDVFREDVEDANGNMFEVVNNFDLFSDNHDPKELAIYVKLRDIERSLDEAENAILDAHSHLLETIKHIKESEDQCD